MTFTKRYWGLIIVLFLSLWAIKPILTPGFFPIHDDTQVVRVYEMAQSLKDGHFPVRWVKDLGYGYGYPLFNFYAPLPYYIGGIINLLGADALTSTKAMMIIGILLSGIFMYFLAREFWKEWGGIVSALFYVYAPYHAVQIFVRGAVGEFWAYAFIPLLFYGLYKIFKQKRWKWVIVGALGLASIILSHNLTAMMTMPFLVIAILLHGYGAYRKRNVLSIKYYLLSILLGLGISAFYWLPALLEIKYTNVLSQVGEGADFGDHFVCLQQLWQSEWGFGGSITGCVDGLSLKLGKLHIIVSLAVFIVSLFLWKKEKLRATIILLSTFYLLSSILMMLEVSKPVWEAIALLAFLQYPWRFLVIAAFTTSFLTGTTVWLVGKFDLLKYLSVGALIILLLSLNIKLFQLQTILTKTSDFYTSEENIKWTTSKISDEYMPKNFIKPDEKENIIRERVNIQPVLVDKTQELSFLIDNDEDKTILVHVAPFPAWRVFIDGSSIDYSPGDNGIEIVVPKGRHAVRFYFVSTQIEKLANIVSIISTLSLFGGILLFRRTSFSS